jgi:hypothetical protein
MIGARTADLTANSEAVIAMEFKASAEDISKNVSCTLNVCRNNQSSISSN